MLQITHVGYQNIKMKVKKKKDKNKKIKKNQPQHNLWENTQYVWSAGQHPSTNFPGDQLR